jgi:hypothetical protein
VELSDLIAGKEFFENSGAFTAFLEPTCVVAKAFTMSELG